jgi:signal transduction histidine kinase
LHLLEVLLDVSAAEAGALTLRRERVDLRAAGDPRRGPVPGGRRAEEHRIEPDLPAPAEMEGDPVRLGQALSNLVDNALKYTPEGGRVSIAVAAEPGAVTVTVRRHRPGRSGGRARGGLAPALSGDASRSQRGLGLGLTLVRAVAEAHGGSATVGDAPGGGARFQLRFPVG